MRPSPIPAALEDRGIATQVVAGHVDLAGGAIDCKAPARAAVRVAAAAAAWHDAVHQGRVHHAGAGADMLRLALA